MNVYLHEVSDEPTMHRLHKFRCDILCDELKLLKRDQYPSGEEYDDYDPYSSHFAGLDDQNNIVVYVRLIHNSPIGYPTKNNMTIDMQALPHRKNYGEISRIFIHKRYRNIQNLKILSQGLFELLYLKMHEYDIAYTFGGLRKPFIRLLKICDIPYHIVGEKQFHLGWRYPCILRTDELLACNPHLLKLKGADATSVHVKIT